MGMAAVDIIRRAVASQKPIIIFGIMMLTGCAVVILRECLESLGQRLTAIYPTGLRKATFNQEAIEQLPSAALDY